MNTFLTLLFILWMMWAVNSILSMSYVTKLCRTYCITNHPKYDHGMIDTIFDYHSPFRTSSWLGFRHWFKPFDIEKKN